MYILSSGSTSLIAVIWILLVVVRIIFKDYTISRLFNILIGIFSLILLTNIFYIVLGVTSATVIWSLLAILLGSLATGCLALFIRGIKLQKSHMQIILLYLLVVIPLITTLGVNYIQNIRYTSYTEKNQDSITVSNPLNNTDRAKADIVSIMGMYNEETYQNAKSTIVYGERVGNIYFANGSWKSYSENTFKPDITIQSLGIDLKNSTESNYNYYATLTTTYVKNDKTQGYSTYLITAKYENNTLVDFIRRRVV